MLLFKLMDKIMYEYYKKRKERGGRVAGNETSVDLKLRSTNLVSSFGVSCRIRLESSMIQSYFIKN